ncbi:MAG: ATP-dependent Clp protease ATP-binding subunit, partial [Deltaproteobacteria bacterium]
GRSRGGGGSGRREEPPAPPVVPDSPPEAEALGRFELDPTEYPWLSGLGRNLTQLAHEGRLDPVIGRSREIEEVIDILGKRRTNNPVLVGEPGVGKTAIVEGLAQALLDLAETRGPLAEKILIELDMASILAGTHLRGSFSEKLNGIKEEVRKANGRVIVFIDEIHTVVGAGATGDGPQDAANELKAALSRGEFPCVGATTHDEYRKFIESDPALERRFTPVLVKEPSVEDTQAILRGVVDRYAAHHGVVYAEEALAAAAELSKRYISDRFLPDKAIGIMDLAGSRARREGKSVVGAEEIARVVSRLAGVPEERLLMTDRERFLRMEEKVSERIVGHEEIVAATARVVRRNYAGFASHRPMGSFLFLGPTGVGKTELAKALAEFLFGSRDALLRVDMSEFGEANTVSRLLGAPPGYVGYGEGGQLTEPVRRRPFAVVLLDEVEKAHRDVLQLLLQVLDEGHLTDGRGRQVSFTNTLVILTSNLGSEVMTGSARRALGFTSGGDEAQHAADLRERVLEVARAAFPPELWNRIDERLVFNPLSRDEVARIAHMLIDESAARLEAEKQIRYRVQPEVLDFLIERGGYDPTMGARPMRRTLQQHLEAPLAEQILSGRFGPGDEVWVSVAGGALRFTRRAHAAQAGGGR